MQFFYPLKFVIITQRFGVKSSLYKTKHPGIDLRAKEDTTIYACADGKVIEAKNTPPYDGYGSYLTLEHGDGYFTVYAHLNAIIVKLGDIVHTGQAIAKTGGNPRRFGAAPLSFFRKGLYTQAGRSTGPHLHLSIRKGGNNPKFVINPQPLLLPNPNLDMPSEYNPDFVAPWAEKALLKARKKGFKMAQPNTPPTKYELAVYFDTLGLLDKLPDKPPL